MLSFASITAAQSAPKAPIGVNFSLQTYGPDGPWQAVTIDAGNKIDLYPGVCGYSILISSRGAAPNAQRGGTYNASSVPGVASNGNTSLTQADGSQWGMTGQYYAGNMSFGNSAAPASGINIISGTPMAHNSTRQLSLGFLDVGFPQSSYSVTGCSTTAGYNCTNSTSPSTYYYQNGMLSSSSFGLTFGSASMGIPGSFHYGGYDPSKIVGPVGVQPFLPAPNSGSLTVIQGGSSETIWQDFFQTTLEQIGIQTLLGVTPLTAGDFSGILQSRGLTVQFDPTSPYIYLPRQVCDALASPLPVTYNSTLNVYLWNTSSPQYTSVIRSPTVLSASLASRNGSAVTISVPFALLNLTLEPPLVAEPTPYFPCQPAGGPTYVLGRAFLQAAYLGANWQPDTPDGVFFFGQAPGPGAPTSQPTGIAAPQSTFTGSGMSLVDSWNGHWSPIPSHSGGLSAGAAAGVGVGVALGVLLLAGLGIGAVLLRRRRNKPRAADDANAKSEGKGAAKDSHDSDSAGPEELDTREVVEFDDGFAKQPVVEAPGDTATRIVEADTGEKIVAELP